MNKYAAAQFLIAGAQGLLVIVAVTRASSFVWIIPTIGMIYSIILGIKCLN